VCELIFSTIQDMKFFLRTGFGDSKEFTSATGSMKTQGMCQGNGMVLVGWKGDSIAMLNAHIRKSHGIHLRSPITKQSTHLAGSIFVDDTNVEYLNMNKLESVEEAHGALQESIKNWGRLLIATGGALKPAKYFCHIISFGWKQDRSWRYEANEARADLGIVVPLADGTFLPIDFLSSNDANKNSRTDDLSNGVQSGGHPTDEEESTTMD
jgi:hypothetical protein